MTYWILVAVAGVLTMPAAARGNDHVSIDIAEAVLSAPIPEGYCLPTGKIKAVSSIMAAADTMNVTVATLFRCDRINHPDGPGSDYFLIKVPRNALLARVSRSDLLASLATEFGRADWTSGSKMAQIGEEVDKSLSETLNMPIAINGEVSPRGADEYCAYLGGSAQVEVGGRTFPTILGSCITSVGEKLLVVHRYDYPTRKDGIAGAMNEARSLALSFASSPPHCRPMG